MDARILDLSFSFNRDDAEPVTWPGDLGLLMVGVAARQSASPTAQAQAASRPEGGVFAPGDGCFNSPVAAALTRWRDE